MLSELITKFQFTIAKQKTTTEHAWLTDCERLDNLQALKLSASKIPTQTICVTKTSQADVEALMTTLLLIDQSNQARFEVITANFMHLHRDDQLLESQVVEVVYGYQRQLYLAYKVLIETIVQQKLRITVDNLVLVFVRCIHVACSMSKWRYFQDQLAPIGTWKHLHELVKVAEKLSILDKTIPLYDNDKQMTSVATLLVNGYMLDTLTKSTLSRQQIELTCQVLKRWVVKPKLESEYIKSEHAFLVNLNGDKGADRVRGINNTSECRYWKTNVLVVNFQNFLTEAANNKTLQIFKLNDVARTSALVVLFKQLVIEWKTQGFIRQRRLESRSDVSRLMKVHNGFNGICEKLAPSSTAKSKSSTVNLTPFELRVAMHAPTRTTATVVKAPIHTEAWLIVDESKKGLGASLNGDVDDSLEPGNLVGFSSTDHIKQLLVAEIKSIKKQQTGRYRIGAEVLSHQVALLDIALLSTENQGQSSVNNSVKEVVDGYFVDFSSMGNDEESRFSGLYLPANTELSQLSMMIIPKSEYKPSAQYLLQLNGEKRHVVIEQMISDYDAHVRLQIKFL
ncbi:MAG: hypothetical protein H7Z18_01250 [Methylophilaceae bacterium]|nr:hypothetical protein [Methylophilaceae bacterium]